MRESILFLLLGTIAPVAVCHIGQKQNDKKPVIPPEMRILQRFTGTWKVHMTTKTSGGPAVKKNGFTTSKFVLGARFLAYVGAADSGAGCRFEDASQRWMMRASWGIASRQHRRGCHLSCRRNSIHRALLGIKTSPMARASGLKRRE